MFNLTKPEYLFRPQQIMRRIFNPNQNVNFPWNVKMTVNPNETIGKSILNTGFHDLTVTESIVRLLESGETAVDAGANMGYFTLLMSKITGPNGKVISYEPHPVIFSTLQHHVTQNGLDNVTLNRTGLSSTSRNGFLVTPSNFEKNQGVASVSFTGENNNMPIALTRLDESVSQFIGVLKIDVEGHELDLLRGASNLLSKGLIRDIIFEDHHAQPSEVSQYLLSFGYSIFKLEKKLLSPKLHLFDTFIKMPSWETPNFIATKDVARLNEKFAPWGWMCMRPYRN